MTIGLWTQPFSQKGVMEKSLYKALYVVSCNRETTIWYNCVSTQAALNQINLTMPRRFTSSQIRTQLRQAQTKRQQAIRNYNSKARQYNANVKRTIDAYNREVRAYNARLRSNRVRLQSALRRLATQTIEVRYSSFHNSTTTLSTAYAALDKSNADPRLSDLAERDTANSVNVLNTLIGDISDSHVTEGYLNSTRISDALARLSTDLKDRWVGAIFALNPNNPEAARHFCASSREIVAGILNAEAPDSVVLEQLPNCPVTEQGTPTRPAKIQYCLNRSGKSHELLEGFIEANIRDLSLLFKDLNSGTHGPAGKFTLTQLSAIKTRVEDAVEFVIEAVS